MTNRLAEARGAAGRDFLVDAGRELARLLALALAALAGAGCGPTAQAHLWADTALPDVEEILRVAPSRNMGSPQREALEKAVRDGLVWLQEQEQLSGAAAAPLK